MLRSSIVTTLAAAAAAGTTAAASIAAVAFFGDTQIIDNNTFTTADSFPDYVDEVTADSPDFYHRLADGSGTTTMADATSPDQPGTYATATSDTSYYSTTTPWSSAVRSNGDNGYVTTDTAATAPDTFTVEMWFQTTQPSNIGGKIFGFGDRKTGTSDLYDRMAYIDAGGQVTFGVWDGSQPVTVTTLGGAKNNGSWFYLVARLGGGTLDIYINGQQEAQTSATGGRSYPDGGYWRIGGDGWDCDWPRIDGCFGSPPEPNGNGYLPATLSHFAVYDYVLPASDISDHYTAGSEATYRSEVLADDPALYWPLDDAGPQRIEDVSNNGRHGLSFLGPPVSVPQAGALGGSQVSNPSAFFSGLGQAGAGYNDTTYTNPNTFTLELWVRTVTTAGGKLIGLGSATTGDSTNYDRHIYMLDDGRLRFGVAPGGTPATITSSASYHDGQWHYVAASLGTAGMRLYVDGSLVADDPAVTSGQNYTGVWRFAGDALAGWPDAPTADYLAGFLDEIAVYDTQLDSDRIAAHYASRDR